MASFSKMPVGAKGLSAAPGSNRFASMKKETSNVKKSGGAIKKHKVKKIK